MSRRQLIASGVACLAGVSAGSTTGTARIQGREQELAAEGFTSPQSAKFPIRKAPFSSPYPRLVLLRDSPMDAAGQRWMGGARAQARLAGVELVLDERSTDGPSLLSVVDEAIQDRRSSAVILCGENIGGLIDVTAAIGAAAGASIPVVCQGASVIDGAAVSVYADDHQLVGSAFSDVAAIPRGSPVGLVTTSAGYGRLDRRVAEWQIIREDAGWNEMLLTEEVKASVSATPDDGLTARLVHEALSEVPDVDLLVAPNAFLLSTAAAVALAEVADLPQLVGVLDGADRDVSLGGLEHYDPLLISASIVDPAQLGAAAVRATSLFLAGETQFGTSAAVAGQRLKRGFSQVSQKMTVGDLLGLLPGVLEGAPHACLTAPWLPAAEVQ